MDKTVNILNKIADICQKKHYSLVTIESCTGGGLAFFITKHPQSSFLLERGFITYSVLSKQDILNISSYKLQTCGVVSKEISIEMAENGLKNSRAQISIAITGVNYEESKIDGIAWIACASIEKNSISKKFKLKGDRIEFCNQLISCALTVLLSYIK